MHDFQKQWTEEYQKRHEQCIREPHSIPSEITSESIVAYNKDFTPFHRFWSAWWLWVTLFPFLLIYVIIKHIALTIYYIPKHYYEHAPKFKFYSGLVGCVHSLWRVLFTIWHPIFQLFHRRAIWRCSDIYTDVDPNKPKWYDAIYFCSIGIILYRETLFLKYYIWATGRSKDIDSREPFTEKEEEEITGWNMWIGNCVPAAFSTIFYSKDAYHLTDYIGTFFGCYIACLFLVPCITLFFPIMLIAYTPKMRVKYFSTGSIGKAHFVFADMMAVPLELLLWIIYHFVLCLIPYNLFTMFH